MALALSVVATISLAVPANAALGTAPVSRVGVSTAAPVPAVPGRSGIGQPAGNPCWPKGTRVKKSNEDRIYLIGPAHFLYWIPTAKDYNSLWGSWNGILSVSPAVFDSCYHDGSLELRGAQLVKNSNPEIFIFEYPYGGYCNIVDWHTFTNVYHFDPAQFDITTAAIMPRTGLAWD